MANYVMPQRKTSDNTSLLGGLGAVAGGVIGTFFGPGAGTAAGAAAGAQLGNMAGNALGQATKEDPKPQAQASQGPGSVMASAMQRRQASMDTDNLSTLRRAEEAAVRLPERQRQEVIPVLTRARIMEERNRGGY